MDIYLLHYMPSFPVKDLGQLIEESKITCKIRKLNRLHLFAGSEAYCVSQCYTLWKNEQTFSMITQLVL